MLAISGRVKSVIEADRDVTGENDTTVKEDSVISL